MNHEQIVNLTTKSSLVVQFITALISTAGLFTKVPDKDKILVEALGLETIVQIIEFGFYLTFLTIFNLYDLTISRYYDWFLTTPVMLFTTCLYFYYEETQQTNNESSRIHLSDFFTQHKTTLVLIFVCNLLMLLCGFLTELGYMDRSTGFVVGTAFLFTSFGFIYKEFARHSVKGSQLFMILFGVWSLYGFAFLMPFMERNISYNILDIIAKNFFGLFLYFTILRKSSALKI
jgi:hypothetical protein